MIRTAALLVLVTGCSIAPSQPADDPALPVSVLSLNGSPGEPRTGDVIVVDDVLLTLRDGKPGRFRRAGDRIHRELDLVGAVVHDANPLEAMTPEQIRGLWGIDLGAWNPSLVRSLRHVDADRTCITVRSFGILESLKQVPELFYSLRYLKVVQPSRKAVARPGPTLEEIGSLEFLSYHAPDLWGLDLEDLTASRGLRYLDFTIDDPGRFSSGHVDNIAALAALDRLRVLKLRRVSGVSSLDFARRLPDLRLLDLRRSDVKDLAPLLEHPSLHSLNLDGTTTERLPRGRIPSLRGLRLWHSSVPPQESARFARDNPQCTVIHPPNNALADAFQGVTSLKVRTGGLCHRDIATEKTLLIERNPKEIHALARSLTARPSLDLLQCGCCGDPTLEFYEGAELRAAIGLHHGKLIRGDLFDDVELTPKAAEDLRNWLLRHVTPDLK